jgi:hypothetical protein
MEQTIEVVGVILLFVLRFGIPIGITILLAYALKRLDAHWQAEAELKAASKEVRQVAISQEPCWELRGCSPEQRDLCPAYAHPNEPCWQVRSANGHLPKLCRDCQVLGRAMVLAGI